MQKIVKKSVAPIYSIAALWLCWNIFGKLYKPVHFIILIIASVAVYFTVRAFDKGTVIEIEEPPVSTGDAQKDQLIAQRDSSLKEMRRLNDNIEDEFISRKIDEIEEVSSQIFDVVVENLEKLPDIRKFMNYYLPTILKLLSTYDKMCDGGVDGENAVATKKKIEDIMDTIVVALKKQLDALYGAEALDVFTDITVLENMLAREGLTEQQLNNRPFN